MTPSFLKKKWNQLIWWLLAARRRSRGFEVGLSAAAEVERDDRVLVAGYGQVDVEGELVVVDGDGGAGAVVLARTETLLEVRMTAMGSDHKRQTQREYDDGQNQREPFTLVCRPRGKLNCAYAATKPKNDGKCPFSNKTCAVRPFFSVH